MHLILLRFVLEIRVDIINDDDDDDDDSLFTGQGSKKYGYRNS